MNLMDKVLQDTYTQTALQKRLRVLRDYLLHKLFVSLDEKADSLKGVNLTVTDLQWVYSLGTDFLNEFDRNNVYQKLQALEEEVKKLPFLTLYLSFEPNDDAIRLLGTFLRKEFTHNMIFESKLNPDLIGGCGVVWKGIYKDYSVKSLIDRKHEEILTNFKTFLKK